MYSSFFFTNLLFDSDSQVVKNRNFVIEMYSVFCVELVFCSFMAEGPFNLKNSSLKDNGYFMEAKPRKMCS